MQFPGSSVLTRGLRLRELGVLAMATAGASGCRDGGIAAPSSAAAAPNGPRFSISAAAAT